MNDRPWRIRISVAARSDFDGIVRWTRDRFGDAQTEIYLETLTAALRALEHGPELLGVRMRLDIGPGYRTLHVAREGRRGRHLILFRITEPEADRVVRVVRILHDAMDPVRHLPADAEES